MAVSDVQYTALKTRGCRVPWSAEHSSSSPKRRRISARNCDNRLRAIGGSCFQNILYPIHHPHPATTLRQPTAHSHLISTIAHTHNVPNGGAFFMTAIYASSLLAWTSQAPAATLRNANSTCVKSGDDRGCRTDTSTRIRAGVGEATVLV